MSNAADETRVKEAGQKAKRSRDRDLSDVRTVLASLSGRRFVWRYLTECGVFQTSFHNSGSVTAFNEGCRNIGLKILADINEASPESYLVMLNESKENDRNV